MTTVELRELELTALEPIQHIACCRRLRGEVGICGTPLGPEHHDGPCPDRDVCSMCWKIAEVHDIPQCYYDETADCPSDTIDS